MLGYTEIDQLLLPLKIIKKTISTSHGNYGDKMSKVSFCWLICLNHWKETRSWTSTSTSPSPTPPRRVLPRPLNYRGKYFKTFEILERLSMTFTANGKRQKLNFSRLSLVVYTVEWNYLYLQWIVGDVIPFLCALFTDKRKELKIRSYLYCMPSADNVMLDLSIISLKLFKMIWACEVSGIFKTLQESRDMSRNEQSYENYKIYKILQGTSKMS